MSCFRALFIESWTVLCGRCTYMSSVNISLYQFWSCLDGTGKGHGPATIENCRDSLNVNTLHRFSRLIWMII